MESRYIVHSLRNTNNSPKSCSLRMALAYLLNKKGHSIPHIASALGVPYSTVSKGIDRTRKLVDVKDKFIMEAIDIFSTHIIDVFAYFEKDGLYYKLKFYIKIDNIKL